MIYLNYSGKNLSLRSMRLRFYCFLFNLPNNIVAMFRSKKDKLLFEMYLDGVYLYKGEYWRFFFNEPTRDFGLLNRKSGYLHDVDLSKAEYVGKFTDHENKVLA
jgi:hypothetical protein